MSSDPELSPLFDAIFSKPKGRKPLPEVLKKKRVVYFLTDGEKKYLDHCLSEIRPVSSTVSSK